MLTPGTIDIWQIRLDDVTVPPPTPGELARAAKFRTPELAARYLKSHAAMRDILARYTTAPLEFALHEHGKPYLPLSPELHFNLSHSHEMALLAVAEYEVGVDIEKLRPMPRYAEVAERFFPSSEEMPVDEVQFFFRWTRIEARLKARGTGLFGLSSEPERQFTTKDVPVPEGFAGAVAAEDAEFAIRLLDYGVTP
jgi:4'-phosphopantetheinyl transferase